MGFARWVVVGIVGLSPLACGKSTLDDVVRQIAKSQAVDETDVRTALRSFGASTDDEMFDLGKRWVDDLPDRPVPSPAVVVDDIARSDDAVNEALRSSVCSAIADVLAGGEVPTGSEFFDSYINAIAGELVPLVDQITVITDFDELWTDAAAGDYTAAQIRIKFMELRYC